MCILVSVERRQRKPGYFGPALFVFLNPPAPALRFTAKEQTVSMLRELAKSIREFKRPSILAPVLVSCEVMLLSLIHI